jgi:hypothetical protein
MAAPVFRYRIVDAHPYLDREEEYDGLLLNEAAARFEDLTPIPADLVLSDLDEGVDWPYRWVDEETGREVTMTREVS